MQIETIRNLTGLSLSIYSDSETLACTLEPEGPRLSIPVVSHPDTAVDQDEVYAPILIETWSMDGVEVPEPEPGVYLIVTQPVALCLWARGRTDILRPGSPVIREGRTVGCIGLVSGQR